MGHPRDAADGLGRAEVEEAGIEPEAVRAQLARILASAEFDASERNRRFLSHVVEEGLAGRGERIKAYGIAVAVFGRDDGFDPQTDPIVRIEARRLRRSLDHYYLLAGKDDSIRIAIPKGGYVPVFQRQAGAAIRPSPEPLPAPPPVPQAPFPGRRLRPKRPSARALLVGVALLVVVALGWLASTVVGALWLDRSAPHSVDATEDGAVRQGPAILVTPFVDDDGDPEHPDLHRGFTREVIAGLTLFDDLFVFGPETAFRQESAAESRRMAEELGVDFILEGGVTVSSGRFRVTAALVDATSERYLWSGRFEGNLAAGDIIEVRDALADQVVRALAQPYGIIFAHSVEAIIGKPPESFTSYECVLQFYRYWHNYDTELYGPVRDCLERAIVADPEYADAFASLALVYVDAYRFSFGRGTIEFDPLPRALQLAQRAVDLAPASTRGHQALHLVHWFMNDVDRSLEIAERGLAHNPNDSELMADLGLRYCLRAEWDKGLPLLQQAYARNPAQSGQYRIALFLHHYINGRYEAALAEAERVEARDVIYGHVALAMAYGKLGRAREAAAEVAEILAIDPAYGDRVVADLQRRNVHPDLIRMVVDGLRAAGMSVDARPAHRHPQPLLRRGPARLAGGSLP